MDDFSKYEHLRAIGFTPKQVHLTAKADGFDEITSIRLLRRVFDLSLADAKRAIGAGDWIEAKQVVKVGSKVYWDDLDSIDGPFLLEARVTAINGPTALLEQVRKFRLLAGDLIEVQPDSSDFREQRVADLERSLSERLKGWENHLKDLIEVAH
jgi:hypothetical protein